MTAAAVTEARAWLGTPYRHRTSVKGEGCDCLGLVRGVWRAVVGAEPEPPGDYAPDWAERTGEERLLQALRRWMVEVAPGATRPGDVLAFRMAPGCAVKHCAVLAEDGERIIHAYWGRAVVESWMGGWWKRRRAAAFRFPQGGE